jgi:PPE family
MTINDHFGDVDAGGATIVPVSMAAAASGAWMSALAARAERAGIQAEVAAGAFQTAVAKTAPPTVIAANRALVPESAPLRAAGLAPGFPIQAGHRAPADQRTCAR